MLKILRNKKVARKIWTGLAVIIIPAFCFWGLGSALRSKQESPAFLAKVFGKTINIQEYIENYRAVRNQYLIQLGQEQLEKLEKYLNIEAQVWERIILLEEAKRQRIKTGDKEVIETLKQFPFFQSEGSFNPKLYKEIITYIFRTDPREFEEQIRNNLNLAKLYRKITDGISLNEKEIKQVYEKENEEISLEYIQASAEDFKEGLSIQDQELLDYYFNNPEQFQEPLSYNLEYIKLENTNEEGVNKLSQLLNQGFTLKNAAKETGLETKETGLFSTNEPVPGIGWSTEILRIVSKLSPGKAWPQPVKVDSEFVYFIKLKEKKQPYIPAFEEINQEVNKRLREHKASQAALEKLETCRKQAETAGFSKAAKEYNLKLGETKLFKRRSYVEGLGDSDLLFEAIEGLNENQISEVINAPSGLYFIVKLKERVLPDQEKFTQEKEDFTEQLLLGKKQNYFQQFVIELRNRPKTFISSPELLSKTP